MTKEQFFGRCIHLPILTLPSSQFDFSAFPAKWKHSSREGKIFFRCSDGSWIERNISDCQIIGRRISQMTEEDYMEFISMGFDNPYDECLEKSGWLFTHSYFPDKYFDELKWVTEEK